MPKSRKTRKQKLRSDQKKNVVKTPVVSETAPLSTPHTFTFSPVTIPSSSGMKSIDVMSYHYLAKDLRKTLLLTIFIIVMEFVLLLIMR